MPTSFARVRRIAALLKTLFTSRTMQSDLGIGQALLNGVIERCTALGLRQMLAVIGDSHNAASIGAHRACGFSYVGVLTSVGRKFDRWVDVVIMQRPLGAGRRHTVSVRPSVGVHHSFGIPSHRLQRWRVICSLFRPSL